MLTKMMVALLGSGFVLAACAGDDGAARNAVAVSASSASNASSAPAINANAEKLVRAAVQKLSSKVEINSVRPSPLPGFYQVIASGQLVYVSTDGRYMLNGDMVDLRAGENLSDAAWAGFRKAELAKVPAAQRIVYAPATRRHTITVFTDVNCGYCRALHEHIGALNKAGIAVEYLAWPREGVTTTSGSNTPTYKEMVSVWCASDRKSAFDDATAGKSPKAVTCANPVEAQFDLGLKLGVSGTPTIVDEDGRVLGGYVEPDKLIKMLSSANRGG